jgi:hypothetical protein
MLHKFVGLGLVHSVNTLGRPDFENSDIALYTARGNPKTFARELATNHEISLYHAESLYNQSPHQTP